MGAHSAEVIEYLREQAQRRQEEFDRICQLPRPISYKVADKFVFFSDSNGRLPTILQFNDEWAYGGGAPLMRELDWFRLLGAHWMMCDSMGWYLDSLLWSPFSDVAYGGRDDYQRGMSKRQRKAFDRRRLLRIAAMMTGAEYRAYLALPDEVTIYRGCHGINKEGISWTLNRRVAEGFPSLMRYHGDGPALLLTAIAKKCNVVAVKLDREEEEIITYQPRIVAEEVIKVPELMAA